MTELLAGVFRELVLQISHFMPKAAAGLMIFALFWVISILMLKAVRRLGRKTHLSSDILLLIGRTVSAVLIVLGAVTALGTAGVDVSALVAGLGLTGFALGFALRDALSNVLSGVLILIYHPFRRNDHISVAGFEGVVINTDLRYTTLQTEDKLILIPNATLFTNTIILLKRNKALIS
jgi:small conductance mechanosensitive channel